MDSGVKPAAKTFFLSSLISVFDHTNLGKRLNRWKKCAIVWRLAIVERTRLELRQMRSTSPLSAFGRQRENKKYKRNAVNGSVKYPVKKRHYGSAGGDDECIKKSRGRTSSFAGLRGTGSSISSITE